MTAQSVAPTIERLLSNAAADQGFHEALRTLANAFGALTATLHRADPDARMLHMVSQLGLPEKLVPITQHIPYGKGMAGLCAERGESITVCNLQTDDSGAVRPGAKLTGVAGAISVPIFAPDGAGLLGTLGIGKPGEHTYTDDEQRTLAECARAFGAALSRA
jgi:L-methionine (R)-S-oxide reductase